MRRWRKLLPSLPASANYTVLRMDPTVFPFMAYALTSASVSQVKLQNLAQYQIVPLLSALPGVARVQVQGGDTAEVEVDVDPHRLAAFHLTLGDVTKAVGAANVLQSVGRIEDHDLLYLLMNANALHTVDDVKNIVVRGGPGRRAAAGGRCRCEHGRGAAVFRGVGGRQAGGDVLLVSAARAADSVAIAREVRQALAGFAAADSAGREVEVNGTTRARWCSAAASSVRDAILIGVVLAAFVLLFFLRSWRITLLAIFIVPASLAAACWCSRCWA